MLILMKGKILSTIKELQFATSNEIKLALGDARKKTFEEKLRELEEGREILRLTSEENSLFVEGFIPGPNLEVEEDPEIKSVLAELKLNRREDVVDWKHLSKRLIDNMDADIKELQEDIEGLYEDPKTLEMRYFDLSLRYHELHRMSYENFNTDSLRAPYDLLQECRSYLDKLEYRETP